MEVPYPRSCWEATGGGTRERVWRGAIPVKPTAEPPKGVLREVG